MPELCNISFWVATFFRFWSENLNIMLTILFTFEVDLWPEPPRLRLQSWLRRVQKVSHRLRNLYIFDFLQRRHIVFIFHLCNFRTLWSRKLFQYLKHVVFHFSSKEISRSVFINTTLLKREREIMCRNLCPVSIWVYKFISATTSIKHLILLKIMCFFPWTENECDILRLDMSDCIFLYFATILCPIRATLYTLGSVVETYA